MSNQQSNLPVGHLSKRRLYTGIGVYIFGQLTPIGIPLLSIFGMSESMKAALSAFVFFGLPPLFTFSAIAILGKDGFYHIKSRVFKLFKRYASLGPVSRTRYHIGLVLFLIPLLLAWITPYITPYLPAAGDHWLKIALAGDILLLTSLLVLGGEFWEKLRALFIYAPKPGLEVTVEKA